MITKYKVLKVEFIFYPSLCLQKICPWAVSIGFRKALMKRIAARGHFFHSLWLTCLLIHSANFYLWKNRCVPSIEQCSTLGIHSQTRLPCLLEIPKCSTHLSCFVLCQICESLLSVIEWWLRVNAPSYISLGLNFLPAPENTWALHDSSMAPAWSVLCCHHGP